MVLSKNCGDIILKMSEICKHSRSIDATQNPSGDFNGPVYFCHVDNDKHRRRKRHATGSWHLLKWNTFIRLATKHQYLRTTLSCSDGSWNSHTTSLNQGERECVRNLNILVPGLLSTRGAYSGTLCWVWCVVSSRSAYSSSMFHLGLCLCPVVTMPISGILSPIGFIVTPDPLTLTLSHIRHTEPRTMDIFYSLTNMWYRMIFVV